MHRFLAAVLSFAAALAGGWVLGFGSPATAQLPPDDPRRGLVYDGLRRASLDGLCRGAFEALLDERHPSMKQVLCTHGPDPAPEGVDVLADRGPDPVAGLPAPSAATPAEGGAVPCYGTGTDGYRVQLIYARSTTASDRFATYEASFRSWAARLNQVVKDSAAKTGGTRNVRFVTDAACNPVIARVALSSTAMSSFSGMVNALHSQGYTRSDRKYLVWADANRYCGISELYVDDSQDPTPGRNYNNGNPFIQGSIGRVDNGCWGLTNMVEAHELVHMLGGVQASAPHATPGFHCLDEYDRLCYDDDSTTKPLTYVCPPAHEALFDCNSDDYFSTAPPRGSYLATHWNTASSAFLSAQAPLGTPTTTTTVPPPTTTTTTTLPQPTTTTSTTAPPATTTTAAPATTTTTQPPAGAVPSAPRSLSARQPAVGAGIVLSWQAPTTGPVTGYRVYRGTSPYSQTLLATTGNVLGYHDATAGPAIFYYRVAAYNAAGEGPPSALAGMIGKTAAPSGVVRDGGSPYGIPSRQPQSAWGVRWA
jgi:hypothetical protein